MPTTALFDEDRPRLDEDLGDLIGHLQMFHTKWCEDPTAGSSVIPCWRIMKIISALEYVRETIQPFP